MTVISDVSQLSDLVAQRYDGLSPQLRKAARFLLDHPDEVPLRSMRDLAVEAGLPVVTFVRLTRALGFSDYADLRALFAARLRLGQGPSGYSGKARALQSRSSGGDEGTRRLIAELFEAE